MNDGPVAAESRQLETLLTALLLYGTVIASVVTGAGLLLALLSGYVGVGGSTGTIGMRIVTAGIACFILLPVIRVAVMLIGYVRERDYRFVGIAAIVLLIIVLGFVCGTVLPARTGSPRPMPRSGVGVPPNRPFSSDRQ